jgi:hypothetical protein
MLTWKAFTQFTSTEVTLAAVKKQIADEEYAKSKSDNRHVIGSCGSDFILCGLEIQDQQYVLDKD